MEDGIEKKILEEMSSRLVASKLEIVGMLKGKDMPKSALDSVMNTMIERGLVVKIYSSTTSFAITKKGIKQAKLFRE